MINIIFGLPGSGKTTYAAIVAKKAHKKKIPVFSNMPLFGCYKLNPRTDLGFYMLIDCIVLIDEAGLDYDSRDYKNFPKENTFFFKMHRHYNTEVHVFSQSYNDMDIKIRNLAAAFKVIKKSIIPFFMVSRVMSRSIGINEQSQKPDDVWEWRKFTRWWHFQPSVWYMFDSWQRETLVEKEWELWEMKSAPVASAPEDPVPSYLDKFKSRILLKYDEWYWKYHNGEISYKGYFICRVSDERFEIYNIIQGHVITFASFILAKDYIDSLQNSD